MPSIKVHNIAGIEYYNLLLRNTLNFALHFFFVRKHLLIEELNHFYELSGCRLSFAQFTVDRRLATSGPHEFQGRIC